jgi:hypothetical protein
VISSALNKGGGSINKFRGVREIGKLSAYPLYHCQDAAMSRKLRDRGQQFVRLKQKTRYQYCGLAVSSASGVKSQTHIRGQVVVDELGYREETGICETNFTPLRDIPKSFTDKELQVASAHIYGFALQQKKWAHLQVSQVCEDERSKLA